MTEPSLVLDHRAVEDHVRDAKLTVLNASAYLVLVSAYGVLRVVLDVPYLRSAVGLHLVVALLVMIVKHRVVHERLAWLVGAAALGLAVNAGVLVALVEVNRGTLFAEATAALVGWILTHLVDRAALADA